jgi:hypothetical protein
MRARPGCARLLARRSGVVNCVDQTKNLGVCRERKGIDPPFIRKDQIRRPGKFNDLSPDGSGDKNNKFSWVATTNFVANRQAAKHVSYPTTAANEDGSLSMSGALKNQPHDKRCPSTSSELQTEKSTPPRPDYRKHWIGQN